MMRRLLRATVKIGIAAAVVFVLVQVARKLMGGLGPEPGTEAAPKEWPSLVPEPGAGAGSNGNGGAEAAASDTGAGSADAEGEASEPAES